MKKSPPVTIRFSRWAVPIENDPGAHISFSKLFNLALNREVEVVFDRKRKVDIGIESVYGNREIPKFKSRARRFVESHMPGGIKFDGGFHTPNQQPSDNARYSVFFTGENERPPEGIWDVYLSFDLNSYRGRNAYLPLWWLTCSDLVVPTVAPYLGKALTIEEMLQKRPSDLGDRRKFCVAFIGKAYPFRMHALSALSTIGKVDVFGGIARNTRQSRAEFKYDIAQKYKFVFCFENDLFPGYVTEKAPEAWATGAVPLYWGSDPAGYLNPKSMLNLAEFASLEEYIERVREVNQSDREWTRIASQNLLKKRPNLDEVIRVIRNQLSSLVRE
jgi:hypothetical protein